MHNFVDNTKMYLKEMKSHGVKYIHLKISLLVYGPLITGNLFPKIQWSYLPRFSVYCWVTLKKEQERTPKLR